MEKKTLEFIKKAYCRNYMIFKKMGFTAIVIEIMKCLGKEAVH